MVSALLSWTWGVGNASVWNVGNEQGVPFLRDISLLELPLQLLEPPLELGTEFCGHGVGVGVGVGVTVAQWA